MPGLDGIREVLQSIGRHRLRTALTAFGIAWGIFLLILLMGVGKGVERGAENLFRDDAFNAVWVEGGKSSLPFNGYAPGRYTELTEEDLRLIGRSFRGIENLTPRRELPGQFTVTYGARTGAFEIQGVYPGYSVIEKTIVTSGRFLSERDVRERRKVAVIGEKVTAVLFGPGASPIGRRVDIAGQGFDVVGTFTDTGGWEGELLRIYVPHSTLRTAFDATPSVGLIAFTTAEGYAGDAMERPIKELLARRHNFDPNDSSAVNIFSTEKEYRKVQNLFLGLRAFVVVVGLGTLFAGAIGVSNIMLVTVKERTREIGIRKALGATPGSILRMVMLEALVVTVSAGYLGLVAGAGAIELIRRAEIKADFFRDPEVDVPSALAALAMLVVAGLVAGLLPARQAVRIKTIDALRHE